jgi:hypothetical protein
VTSLNVDDKGLVLDTAEEVAILQRLQTLRQLYVGVSGS